MLFRQVIRLPFGKVKPLKIHGQTEGSGVHFVSSLTPNNIQIQSPLETLIASLAACELGTLRAITRGSDFKIHSVKYVRVESGIDVQKFMKGGPQDKIEDVYIEAEVESNGTQKDLDMWLEKALYSCPVVQMFKLAGVKIQSKWTNVKTLP